MPPRRLFAAESSNQIEFRPSRRAAAVWLAWLVAAVMLTFQSSLPMVFQFAIAASTLWAGGMALHGYVLLRGASALRGLEWPAGEEGAYFVHLGPGLRRLPASPEGCERYGEQLWLLRFRTGEGWVKALIDTSGQDPRSLRRLGRRLFADVGRQAATMPPKV
jgi:hypothetical protein